MELKDKLLKINKKEVIETLKIDQYTLDDIIDCLIKPNRSIRDQYQTPLLKKDILHIEDLKPGMVLEGTVRNVVDFGAFVDIGLKNDGLVHISKMSKNQAKFYFSLSKKSMPDFLTALSAGRFDAVKTPLRSSGLFSGRLTAAYPI